MPKHVPVRHVLKKVPEHVPTHMLKHVPNRHMLGTVLEHVPKKMPQNRLKTTLCDLLVR